MKFGILAATAALALVLGAGSASAASIAGLYNTGVDNAGVVQANGAAELHYNIVSSDYAGTPATRVATSSNGYPFPYWNGDDAASAWIGPVGDSALDGPYGVYDYQTTFSLTGLQAASAAINGMWGTDDYGFDILINGQSTGNFSGSFYGLTGFSIGSGFQAGTNTLDFIVFNSGGPTGLRVEMDGTPAGAVPEPTTWAMLIAGLFGMGLALRSRRKELPAAA